MEPVSHYFYSHRLKLQFWDWGTDGKPALILVHGGLDHARMWDWVARALRDDFHVYALEWEPGEIRWLVDGKLYQTQNFWWSCSDRDGPKGVNPVNEKELNPWPAPFDQPY